MCARSTLTNLVLSGVVSCQQKSFAHGKSGDGGILRLIVGLLAWAQTAEVVTANMSLELTCTVDAVRARAIRVMTTGGGVI